MPSARLTAGLPALGGRGAAISFYLSLLLSPFPPPPFRFSHSLILSRSLSSRSWFDFNNIVYLAFRLLKAAFMP